MIPIGSTMSIEPLILLEGPLHFGDSSTTKINEIRSMEYFLIFFGSKPVKTRDTTGTGDGMLWVAKFNNCTCTCKTHGPKLRVEPIPVTFPTHS